MLGGGEGGTTSMPTLVRDYQERIKKGEYKLPLYADMAGMFP